MIRAPKRGSPRQQERPWPLSVAGTAFFFCLFAECSPPVFLILPVDRGRRSKHVSGVVGNHEEAVSYFRVGASFAHENVYAVAVLPERVNVHAMPALRSTKQSHHAGGDASAQLIRWLLGSAFTFHFFLLGELRLSDLPERLNSLRRKGSSAGGFAFGGEPGQAFPAPCESRQTARRACTGIRIAARQRTTIYLDHRILAAEEPYFLDATTANAIPWIGKIRRSEANFEKGAYGWTVLCHGIIGMLT